MYAQMLPLSLPIACNMVPCRHTGFLHVCCHSLWSLNISSRKLPRNSITELICFIVLDIGLDVTESLPPWTRVVAGLFQSFAVRASGFPIVSIASLAPSFQYACSVRHRPGAH